MNPSKFSDNDVVISGLSVALPGIDSLEKLSTTLFEGLPLRATVRESTPSGYHDELPAPGGKLKKSNELDSIFFGLNQAAFIGTDRVQLKALEACYVALMDAGVNTTEIKKMMCHVYGSASRTDGEHTALVSNESRYFLLGHSRAIGPNRVSFFLDQNGSSVFLDNFFSGSMQSLEVAWRDIREGRCDMALVCSTNIFPGENITAAMNDLGWLSNNGKVCSFDNEADGFQRTEGTVALVLQPVKHAKRIYAKINHVRCSTIPNPKLSLIKPSKENWIQFLNNVYADCGISKDKIQYLEAYGAAIKDWDASELNAIMDVFCGGRKEPLIVGSVKSNVGHTEGAADLVSIVKAIVCFENEKITPNNNYQTPNDDVSGLISGHLKVAASDMTLPTDALIGINSFSHGNVYGHCILQGFKKPNVNSSDTIPRLVLLSGRTDELMQSIIHHVEEIVPFDTEYISLVHEIFKDNIAQHLARGYTILPKQEKSFSYHESVDARDRPLWFVFSGMGSQWPGMGRHLMKLPLARSSIQKCHDILLQAGLDLINILTTEDPKIFQDNLNSFVGIGAVQIALVDILNALKIVPDGIIGHSLGELACGYLDRSLTLEQTILSAYYRGKAVKDATLVKGAMAAVGKGYNEIKDSLPENVEVACHNSSSSSTISGTERQVLNYVEELKNQSVFAKVVEVGEIAFHSRFIAPAGPYLLSYMEKVIKNPKLRSKKWISTSVPEDKWNETASLYSSAEYFTNNLLQCVRFEEGCAHVPTNAILLEIAPHGLLQAILKRSFPQGISMSLTNRSAADNLVFLLQSIGKLYTIGFNPDVAALYPKPDFPVATKTNSLHRLSPWCFVKKNPKKYNYLKKAMDLRKLVKTHDIEKGEHLFRGRKIAPASYYPYLIWYSCYQSDPNYLQNSFSFESLRFFNPFSLSITNDLWVEGIITLKNSQLTEITKNGKLLTSAIASEHCGFLESVTSITSEQPILISLTRGQIYDALERQGYAIAKSMRHLISVDWTHKGLRGKLRSTGNWVQKFEAMTHLLYLYNSRLQDHLVMLKKIGRMEVSTDADYSHNDLDIFYDIATNELSCSGLYLRDVTFESEKDHSKLTIQSVQPYVVNNLKTIEEFIDFCGQIISEFNVLEVPSESWPTLSTILKSTFHKINVTSIATGHQITNHTKHHLVVCDSKYVENLSAAIHNYVLVRTFNNTHEALTPEGFAVVSSFSCDQKETVMLLKRKVVLNGEAQFINIPENENDLISILKLRQKSRTNALLLGDSEPKEGFLNFIKRVQSQTTMLLKWMFILDENALEFSISNSFYQGQLEKGLHLNILLNGIWNNIYVKQVGTKSADNYAKTNSISKVGKEKIGCVIGKSSDILPTWEIDYKDEVAASYAMAYYCLVLIARVLPGEAVLVTDGGSVFGQAIIRVALPRVSRVCATVGSEEEVRLLKILIPELDENNIFLHCDENFVMKLKHNVMHDDAFPNIVFNTLEGQRAKDFFLYPSKLSHIFHFGTEDIKNNYSLSTSALLRYVSLFVLSMENINNWHIEDKHKVQQLINDGLLNGTVVPLQQIASSLTLPHQIDQKSQRITSTISNEHNFGSAMNGSYLIIGDTADVDLDIADWLARRGANDIFIYNPSEKNSTEYACMLRLIGMGKKVHVQRLKENLVGEFVNLNAQTIQLDAIFYIHLSDQETIVAPEFINTLEHMKSDQFVTISKNRRIALKLQKIISPKHKCTAIIWDDKIDNIGRNMDKISNLIGTHNFVSVTNDSTDKIRSQNLHGSLSRRDLVSNTLESMCICGNLSEDLRLTELSTSGQLMKNSADCQPVFIIPGIEDDAIESTEFLAKGLLYPTFAVIIPVTDSIERLASAIITEIVKICDRKVYNLVGLSVGCVVAMEVARQMELNGKVAAVLLVDNPLSVLHEAVNNIDLTQLSHTVNVNPQNERLATDRAETVNTFLKTVSNYSLDDFRLKGPLTIMKSNSFNDDLVDYNKMCFNSYIVDTQLEHKNLLRSKELQIMINKFVVLEDASPKSIHQPLWITFDKILDEYSVYEKQWENKSSFG